MDRWTTLYHIVCHTFVVYVFHEHVPLDVGTIYCICYDLFSGCYLLDVMSRSVHLLALGCGV